MSIIVEAKGYDNGIHISGNDTIQFSLRNEDWVAFRVQDKGIFFGNISHGDTHKIVIDGKQVFVKGFRWVWHENHIDRDLREALKSWQGRSFDQLTPISIADGVQL
jgi:hypothetical protein